MVRRDLDLGVQHDAVARRWISKVMLLSATATCDDRILGIWEVIRMVGIIDP